MKIVKTLRKMCTPAQLYFAISMISFAALFLNNLGGGRQKLCVGVYDCHVENINLVYIFNLLYILFFTIVLDSLCKNGYSSISWFLVIFPFLMFFTGLGVYMVSQNNNNNKEENK